MNFYNNMKYCEMGDNICIHSYLKELDEIDKIKYKIIIENAEQVGIVTNVNGNKYIQLQALKQHAEALEPVEIGTDDAKNELEEKESDADQPEPTNQPTRKSLYLKVMR